MRVFLTGGAGFLGCHVAAALLRRGHELGMLLRNPSRAWRLSSVLARCTIVSADLGEEDRLGPALKQFAPDAIIHLAWSGVTGRERNDQSQWRNVDWTRSLAFLAADAGARCWIGLGSQAEYGAQPAIVSEASATNPVTEYGKAKLAACRAVQAICDGRRIRAVWLRLFSCYGPADHESYLLPYIILSLLRGEIPKLTKAEQRWDYLFVGEAAEAICRVLETPAACGIFNLASGKAVLLREVIECVRDIVNPSSALGFGAIAYGGSQIMHLQADIARLQAVTGWSPSLPLRDGVAVTAAWFRENLSRYDADVRSSDR